MNNIKDVFKKVGIKKLIISFSIWAILINIGMYYSETSILVTRITVISGILVLMFPFAELGLELGKYIEEQKNK